LHSYYSMYVLKYDAILTSTQLPHIAGDSGVNVCDAFNVFHNIFTKVFNGA